MNHEKIGSLLRSLRQEQKLTQKQLADQLHLSDKTISKWERGAGLPDIAMLKVLSEVFQVDVEKLLSGDLQRNQADGGNMKRVKFYVCPSCRNTLTATAGNEISCCGRKLTALVPQAGDGEHAAVVEKVEGDYYITFPNHPMTKEHYITFAALVDMDRMLLLKLYPEQMAELRFPRMHGGKFYYHCNQHGLFTTPIG